MAATQAGASQGVGQDGEACSRLHHPQASLLEACNQPRGCCGHPCGPRAPEQAHSGGPCIGPALCESIQGCMGCSVVPLASCAQEASQGAEIDGGCKWG